MQKANSMLDIQGTAGIAAVVTDALSGKNLVRISNLHFGVAEYRRGQPETQEHLTTREAAAYLRRSTSWLVKRNDIPFVRGTPNTYKKSDLDGWFKANKFVPNIRGGHRQ